jgi:hypothetical protein
VVVGGGVRGGVRGGEVHLHCSLLDVRQTAQPPPRVSTPSLLQPRGLCLYAELSPHTVAPPLLLPSLLAHRP